MSKGIMNKHALSNLAAQLSASGTLRSREITPGRLIFDVNAPVVELQKTSAFVAGAGRLVIAKGAQYIPAYTMAIGTSVGSGYTVPSDGVYLVESHVSVSGVAIENYCGSVLVNSVPASGTASFAASDARGAACIHIHGIVHAAAGQTINVGVKSIHGNITTIGSEDLIHAPAANMLVYKLPSDMPTVTGS